MALKARILTNNNHTQTILYFFSPDVLATTRKQNTALDSAYGQWTRFYLHSCSFSDAAGCHWARSSFNNVSSSQRDLWFIFLFMLPHRCNNKVLQLCSQTQRNKNLATFPFKVFSFFTAGSFLVLLLFLLKHQLSDVHLHFEGVRALVLMPTQLTGDGTELRSGRR